MDSMKNEGENLIHFFPALIGRGCQKNVGGGGNGGRGGSVSLDITANVLPYILVVHLFNVVQRKALCANLLPLFKHDFMKGKLLTAEYI